MGAGASARKKYAASGAAGGTGRQKWAPCGRQRRKRRRRGPKVDLGPDWGTKRLLQSLGAPSDKRPDFPDEDLDPVVPARIHRFIKDDAAAEAVFAELVLPPAMQYPFALLRAAQRTAMKRRIHRRRKRIAVWEAAHAAREAARIAEATCIRYLQLKPIHEKAEAKRQEEEAKRAAIEAKRKEAEEAARVAAGGEGEEEEEGGGEEDGEEESEGSDEDSEEESEEEEGNDENDEEGEKSASEGEDSGGDDNDGTSAAGSRGAGGGGGDEEEGTEEAERPEEGKEQEGQGGMVAPKELGNEEGEETVEKEEEDKDESEEEGTEQGERPAEQEKDEESGEGAEQGERYQGEEEKDEEGAGEGREGESGDRSQEEEGESEAAGEEEKGDEGSQGTEESDDRSQEEEEGESEDGAENAETTKQPKGEVDEENEEESDDRSQEEEEGESEDGAENAETTKQHKGEVDEENEEESADGSQGEAGESEDGAENAETTKQPKGEVDEENEEESDDGSQEEEGPDAEATGHSAAAEGIEEATTKEPGEAASASAEGKESDEETEDEEDEESDGDGEEEEEEEEEPTPEGGSAAKTEDQESEESKEEKEEESDEKSSVGSQEEDEAEGESSGDKEEEEETIAKETGRPDDEEKEEDKGEEKEDEDQSEEKKDEGGGVADKTQDGAESEHSSSSDEDDDEDADSTGSDSSSPDTGSASSQDSAGSDSGSGTASDSVARAWEQLREEEGQPMTPRTHARHVWRRNRLRARGLAQAKGWRDVGSRLRPHLQRLTTLHLTSLRSARAGMHLFGAGRDHTEVKALLHVLSAPGSSLRSGDPKAALAAATAVSSSPSSAAAYAADVFGRLDEGRPLLRDRDVALIAYYVHGIGHAAPLGAVKKVDLTDQRVGPEALHCLLLLLPLLPSLRTLDLKHCRGGPRLPSYLHTVLLRSEPSGGWPLRELDLTGHRMGERGASALAEALLRLPHLRSLNVYDNGVGNRGVMRLAAALARHRSVRHLDLGLNELTDFGAAAVSEVIDSAVCPLRTLDLWDCRVGHDGGCALARAVRYSTHLRRISLWGSPLSPHAVRLLASALGQERNTHLRELDLRGVEGLRSSGAAALAEALTHADCPLQSLLLADCPIGDGGVAALGEALAVCTCLRHLDVKRVGCGPRGFAVLLAGLRSNRSLDGLGAGEGGPGGVGPSDVASLALVLRDYNSTLANLDLHPPLDSGEVAACLRLPLFLHGAGDKAVMHYLRTSPLRHSLREPFADDNVEAYVREQEQAAIPQATEERRAELLDEVAREAYLYRTQPQLQTAKRVDDLFDPSKSLVADLEEKGELGELDEKGKKKKKKKKKKKDDAVLPCGLYVEDAKALQDIGLTVEDLGKLA